MRNATRDHALREYCLSISRTFISILTRCYHLARAKFQEFNNYFIVDIGGCSCHPT